MARTCTTRTCTPRAGPAMPHAYTMMQRPPTKNKGGDDQVDLDNSPD